MQVADSTNLASNVSAAGCSVISHAGLWKVVERGRSMRKLADGRGVMDYIGQWWPFSQLGERGGFIQALLGGEDWTRLDGTDPGRG